jgi:branched-chain amino acid transport system permease protein
MDPLTFALLGQDGLVTGAIYALLAMGLVLVYTVTHVPFIPIGCFLAYAALSLSNLQENRAPGLVWVVLVMGLACFVMDALHARHAGPGGAFGRRAIARSALFCLATPALLCLLTVWSAGRGWPMVAEMGVVLLLTMQFAPLLHRLVFAPLLDASILTLFMLSTAVDVAMTGVGLVLFGPDGIRTLPYSEARFQWGGLVILGQSLWILAIAAALMVVLYIFFTHSVRGKMLRATAINRTGARLMGISIEGSGQFAFIVTAAIAGLCGMLIAPRVTVDYASGQLIGLKGFIAAVAGGFTSYPLAVAGAVLIGLLESFSTFWSSAWKDVIVFVLIIPVLLIRSILRPPADEH